MRGLEAVLSSFVACGRAAQDAVDAAVRRAAPPKAIPTRKVDRAAIGRGFSDPRQRAGTKRLAITLDDATFARVRAHALANKISAAAAARELIERGASAEKEGVVAS